MDRVAFAGGARRAWREYRLSVALSTGLFVLGALFGAGFWLAGLDMLSLLGLDSIQDALPDIESMTQTEIFLTILFNNSRAFAIFVLGAATLGLFTALGLLFNGLLIGYVVASVAAQRGIAFVVVGIGPHGIFELPALFVGGAIAFRLVFRTGWRLVSPALADENLPDWIPEPRNAVMSHGEWRRTVGVAAVAYGTLAFAAAVEAFVTTALLATFFGAGG